MIIRFKYERGRELKYLAHLDMMTLFERAIKRAKIDVAFSNGFNKRPQIVFGMPISLGMISSAEYADITLGKDMECDDFQKKLNEKMPLGIMIIDAIALNSEKNIMSSIAFAKYRISLGSQNGIEKAIIDLLKEERIVVEKIKKGRKIEKEIRQGLISVSYTKDEIHLFMTSGQSKNIKPEEVISALEKYKGSEIEVIDIFREEMYIADSGGRPALPIVRSNK